MHFDRSRIAGSRRGRHQTTIHHSTRLFHQVLTSTCLMMIWSHITVHGNARMFGNQSSAQRELWSSRSLSGHYSNSQSIVYFYSIKVCRYAIMRALELEHKLTLPHRRAAIMLIIRMHECFEIIDASRRSYLWWGFSVDISSFSESIVHFYSDICGRSLRREMCKGEKKVIVA